MRKALMCPVPRRTQKDKRGVQINTIATATRTPPPPPPRLPHMSRIKGDDRVQNVPLPPQAI